MSNHTIKAKNKNSQEVRSINVIDNGDNCEYYDDKWDVIYSKQEFNDLFEAVEDSVTIASQWASNIVYNAPMGEITTSQSLPHEPIYTDIPQTDRGINDDTLKKENKTFEEFLKELHAEHYMGYDDDMPDNFEYWLEDVDLIRVADKFITQEIDKAKEEIVEEIVEKIEDYSVNSDWCCRRSCNDIINLINNK